MKRVRFIDKTYNVPIYAAKRMHRLNLLMNEYPEAEELWNIS